MKRPVKFRGKRKENKENGEWVYGYYGSMGSDEESKLYIIPFGMLPWAAGYVVEIIPESLGQFIGKKDRNEKDLYEGMRAKAYHSDYPQPFVGVIQWDNDEGEYVFEQDFGGTFPMKDYEEFEVIEK